MTNKEKAQALIALVDDEARSLADRREAWNELNALKKTAKTSFQKLGVTDAWRQAAAVELLAPKDYGQDMSPGHDGSPIDPLDEKPVKPVVKAQVEGKDIRGLVTAEVKRLLTETEMPYKALAEEVRRLHPDAKTTARSVASTASDLRSKGQTVPERQRNGK